MLREPGMPSLKDRVAIVTGASRGIGRECALALARRGCHVVIAAKSTEPQPTLPGSIYTVAAEVEALGVQALPFVVDLRDESTSQACVNEVMKKFGRIDSEPRPPLPPTRAHRPKPCAPCHRVLTAWACRRQYWSTTRARSGGKTLSTRR